MQRSVYKVLSRLDWDAAVALGAFSGSADDHRDGYIHLSTAAQLPGTLSRFFGGVPDLVLVRFDADSLGPDLRWEPARDGQLFPHLYRPLPAADARIVHALPLAPDGRHVLPEDLP